MKKALLVVTLLVAAAVVSVQAQDQGVQLRRALFAGTAAQITALAKVKPAVNSADADGTTPLMIASALGKTDVVKTLLEAGATVEAQTKADQISALMFAADLAPLDTVQALVAGGAVIAATDRADYSAIDYATVANVGDTRVDLNREMLVAKFLRSKGGKLRKESSSGRGAMADLKRLLDKAKAAAK